MGGISPEKKEVNNLSTSREGKSILEISQTSLEQNIFVCGNYNLEFFEKNIISGLINPRKENNNAYDKMAKHKAIKDWQFFFAPKIGGLVWVLIITPKPINNPAITALKLFAMFESVFNFMLLTYIKRGCIITS